MLPFKVRKKYYQALLQRDKNFDGVFYVGVKTTGVFCRSVCPAKKPKFENCEFFSSAEDALLASYRPCYRCHPLSLPEELPQVVKKLVEEVEKHPEKRWKAKDFENLSTNAAQASRAFKKRFNMTFVAYARARRMGIALGQIRGQSQVIDAQLDAGYESGSGFRDAFSKIMGAPPKQAEEVLVLKSQWIDTLLGPMLAISDETHLYLLEFTSRRGLEKEIEQLRSKTNSAIIPGESEPLRQIKQELTAYFKGTLKSFKTPIKMLGTPFQRRVWNELLTIAYGKTVSYMDIAIALDHPKAIRAIGQANGKNQLALIIPCHRVINSTGQLGGYGGGVSKKQWLLTHEGKYV